MKCLPVASCLECPYRDHSGRFTPGGAYPLCGAVKHRGRKPTDYEGVMRVLPWEPAADESGHTYRKGTGVIPEWCPLPNRR